MKHIRIAIKLSKVPADQIRVEKGRGHIKLYIGKQYAVASCSPKDADTAAIRIARDLKKIAL